MPNNVKLKDLGHHLLDAVDSRVTEFKELVTVLTNKMIMLRITVGGLVFGVLVSKLMAPDQLTLNEEVQRIVYRGSANSHVVRFELQVEFIGIKVVRSSIYFFQDCDAFGCLPKLTLLQKGFESASNLCQLYVVQLGHSISSG